MLTMKSVALAGILFCFTFGHWAAADEGQRFQAVPINKPEQFGETVFILDTRTGDAWTYYKGPGTDNTSGALLRYEGAVVPGDTPGEVIARSGFKLDPIQRRRD